VAFATCSMFTALRDVRGLPGDGLLLALPVSWNLLTARRITFCDGASRFRKCRNGLCAVTMELPRRVQFPPASHGAIIKDQ
jgi:hypothetical protein